jgi:hypothetical protein
VSVPSNVGQQLPDAGRVAADLRKDGPEFAHLYCLREPEPSMLLS